MKPDPKRVSAANAQLQASVTDSSSSQSVAT